MCKRTSPAWYFYRCFVATFFNQKLKLISVRFISTARVNGTLRSGSEMRFRTLSLKKNTSCLGFCTFWVLSNTSSGRGTHLVSDSAFFGYFRTHFSGFLLRERTRLVSYSALFQYFQTLLPGRSSLYFRFCTFPALSDISEYSPCRIYSSS